ncbi:type I-B CRISPR-associated protein Cas5b [Caldisalinibacter kiritimatiensis]|uniref:CRISPR-associated protein n=1 Tax=Caldisalinibacter kiritimatiensis TaxID=1304284 RepID=R1AYN9_9FIRM|nr:type I-B CRISPR-associated protein Cas5b [Caldisalinibacter kiritimatiensis]EOD01822.1 CRISPR-associated protein [Caldisalinibacter kiritimatiensis]
MKVLKLTLFQETACYKKPFAFKVWETYPLPPYSTVKGMLHNILKADEFIPMSISIQGDYESKFVDYQSMYFYKSKEITNMPLNVHLLHNVKLIIHVKAEDAILQRIIDGIRNLEEHLSLGRREDLVRIDDIKFVKIQEIDIDDLEDGKKIEHPIYIPVEQLPEDVWGINYRLNWKYEVVNDLRQWERIDVKYVESGEEITDDNFLQDEEGDIVYFNTPQ